LTLVAGAATEATAENGPPADSSSEAVVNNSFCWAGAESKAYGAPAKRWE